MRTKLQKYNDIASVIAEVDVATQDNDMVYAEAERKLYIADTASTAIADGLYILQETRTVGAGRLHAIVAASGFFSGNANSNAIPNGNSAVADIAIAGVLAGSFNLVKVTNQAALNLLGLDVIGAAVNADGNVRVVLYNNTGNNIAAQSVAVQIVQF